MAIAQGSGTIGLSWLTRGVTALAETEPMTGGDTLGAATADEMISVESRTGAFSAPLGEGKDHPTVRLASTK